MRPRLALVAVVLLAWSALAGAQTAELQVKLRLAVRKLEQGDALGALLDIENVLARDDRYWEAYFERGRAQAQMGDDLGARVSFLRATELDPGNAELHFLMATMSWQLADFDPAWSQAIMAVQAGYPREPVDQLIKGLADYSEGPPDLEARLTAERVVVVVDDPGDDALWEQLDDLALEMRSGLLAVPLIGLTKLEPLARYRVEMTSRDDGAAIDVVLTESSGSEELYRGEIIEPGGIDDAATQLQVMDQVDEIAAVLRGETGS